MVVSTIGTCSPERGIQLWDATLQGRYLDTKKAEACKSCWAFLLVAHARAGVGNGTSNAEGVSKCFQDYLKLSNFTPYRHVWQIPPMVNTALLTKEPEPYRDPQEDYVCQAIETYRIEILKEYAAYREAVYEGRISNLHESNHEDKSLSETSGGGWDGLFLRRVHTVETDEFGDGEIGWQEHVCTEYFPKTCSVLQSLRQVSGKLLPKGGRYNCASHDNDEYLDWCRGMEGQYAGVIAFYSLQPKASLRLHTGPTNQRLKCHLVVTAPKDGSAWMEVGGIRKSQTSGDIIAFDDSYLHMVGNDGDEERVILDVTFWHPKLSVSSQDATNSQSLEL